MGCTAAVEEHPDPIIFEGDGSETAVVINAGSDAVELGAWSKAARPCVKAPLARLELRPGNTRIVRSALIRVSIFGKNKLGQGGKRFAVVGWSTKS